MFRSSGSLIGLSLGLIAVSVYAATRKSRRGGFTFVRNAGPDNMENPPPVWDQTDQAIDESFPASDPPTQSRFN